VLQQIAPRYQAKSGEQIVLNLGSSNTLARQISFGAGPDVFISADEAQMKAVADLIDPATRVDLLANQLAIAVPDDRPRADRFGARSARPSIQRIAIGDPAAVPAVVYAKQYLQTLGHLDRSCDEDRSIRQRPPRARCRGKRRRRRGDRVSHDIATASARPRGARRFRLRKVRNSCIPPRWCAPAATRKERARFLAFLRTPRRVAVFTAPASPFPPRASDATVSAEIREIAIFTTVAALGATALMLVPGVAVAWLLARRQFPGKSVRRNDCLLPLVMPPVATGLLLLWLFSGAGPIGGLLARFGIDIVFTPAAVVIAMAVMGLPLLVRTARAGFEQ
jgi:ABC-type sugar transport system permease subunit